MRESFSGKCSNLWSAQWQCWAHSAALLCLSVPRHSRPRSRPADAHFHIVCALKCAPAGRCHIHAEPKAKGSIVPDWLLLVAFFCADMRPLGLLLLLPKRFLDATTARNENEVLTAAAARGALILGPAPRPLETGHPRGKAVKRGGRPEAAGGPLVIPSKCNRCGAAPPSAPAYQSMQTLRGAHVFGGIFRHACVC